MRPTPVLSLCTFLPHIRQPPPHRLFSLGRRYFSRYQRAYKRHQPAKPEDPGDSILILTMRSTAFDRGEYRGGLDVGLRIG